MTALNGHLTDHAAAIRYAALLHACLQETEDLDEAFEAAALALEAAPEGGFAIDAGGHEHKGAGEGGGQFTGHGEGGDSGEPAAKKPAKPKHGERAAAAHKSYHELIGQAKKARLDAYNDVKADAIKARDAHAAAAAEIIDHGQSVAWDADEDEPFNELESAISEYDEEASPADRMAALKGVETAARAAAEHEQAVTPPEVAKHQAAANAAAQALADHNREAGDFLTEVKTRVAKEPGVVERANAKLTKGGNPIQLTKDEAGNVFLDYAGVATVVKEANDKLKSGGNPIKLTYDGGNIGFDKPEAYQVEGLTQEEAGENKRRLAGIVKASQTAREQLRAYVKHRKEMQAIKDNSPPDAQLSMEEFDDAKFAFDESKVKRDDGGQFADKAGSPAVSTNTNKIYGTDFEINGKPFFFEAQKDSEGWHIGFGLTKNRGGNTAAMTHDKSMSPFKVLRMVEKSITSFIAEKKPDTILFTGEKYESSRIDFYDKISEIMAETFGYDLEVSDYPVMKEYILRKKKDSTLSIDAMLAHDIFSRKAQGILNRTLAAARGLSAAARRQLVAALKLRDWPAIANAVVDWIKGYRVQLAGLLSTTNLAALLAGAQEVAKKIPEVPPAGVAPPPPPTLEPEAAQDLLDDLRALPDEERGRRLYELPPDQQSYAQAALRSTGNRPPAPPPFAAPVAEGETERVHFPVIDEAVAELSAKNVMDRASFDALDAAARAKAFTVAGVESLDTLAKIRDVLAANVDQGADYETFGEKVLDAVDAGTFLSEAHRENVFRTNVQAAFSDGQMKVLRHPFVASGFPYAAYEAIHDDRVEDTHLEMETLGIDGTNVFRIADPVFETFRPPWRWQCRCSWIPLTVRQAAARGVAEAQRWLDEGVEPSPPAFVAMPDFRPPPGFQRSVAAAPLSIRLSMIGADDFAPHAAFRTIPDIALSLEYDMQARILADGNITAEITPAHPQYLAILDLIESGDVPDGAAFARGYKSATPAGLFDEEEHPRDEGGQFTEKGGGVAKKAAKKPREKRELKTMTDASKELESIRNDAASTEPDDDLKERADAVGEWLAKNAKPTGLGAKLLNEVNELADKLDGGSGKLGGRTRIQIKESAPQKPSDKPDHATEDYFQQHAEQEGLYDKGQTGSKWVGDYLPAAKAEPVYVPNESDAPMPEKSPEVVKPKDVSDMTKDEIKTTYGPRLEELNAKHKTMKIEGGRKVAGTGLTDEESTEQSRLRQWINYGPPKKLEPPKPEQEKPKEEVKEAKPLTIGSTAGRKWNAYEDDILKQKVYTLDMGDWDTVKAKVYGQRTEVHVGLPKEMRYFPQINDDVRENTHLIGDDRKGYKTLAEAKKALLEEVERYEKNIGELAATLPDDALRQYPTHIKNAIREHRKKRES